MNIEQVLEMWKEDSIIDDLKLDDTTVRMARVHSKYLELITIAKIRRKKKDLDSIYERFEKRLFGKSDFESCVLKFKKSNI